MSYIALRGMQQQPVASFDHNRCVNELGTQVGLGTAKPMLFLLQCRHPLAALWAPKGSTGRTVGGHRHWADTGQCQRRLCCGSRKVTTALFWLAGPNGGHCQLFSVPLQELCDIYDIDGYITMKLHMYTHSYMFNISVSLFYSGVLYVLLRTILQRRLCCGSRNLTTSMLWVPQPDDGCALGPGP